MAALPEDVKTALSRYEQSLEDLTFNSKPLIDGLTRTADQLGHSGNQIVKIIQNRIMKVRPEWKLPALYLLDSIMKNLKGSFLEHVNQIIVEVFCHCFERLTDPDPRKSLYKLRTTWPPFLAKHKLAAIDKHIHALDPNWPVVVVDKDPPAATIFINPAVFVGEPTQNSTTSIEDRRKALLQKKRNERQEQEREMGISALNNKVKESTHLENLKKPIPAQHGSRPRSTSPLPITTLATRSHSASPPRSYSVSTAASSDDAPPAKRQCVEVEADSKETSVTSEVIKQSQLQLDDVPPELLQTHHKNMLKRIERQIDIGNLTPGQKNILVGQLNQLYELQKLKSDQTSTLPELSDSSSLNTKPVHSESNQERFQIPNNAPQPSHHIGLDSGQVRGQAPYRRSGPRRPYRGRGSQVEMPPRVWPLDGGDPGRGDFSVPNLTLTPATLKQRYSSVIVLLHSGDPCSSCGLRFLSNTEDLYRSHLNWHYKVNRQDKEGTSKTSRNWFMHPDDWFKYEELAEDSDSNEVKLKQPKKESPVSSSETSAECKHETGNFSVEAGDADEVCTVCNEPFEQFWEEEEEAWHFRDAMKMGGKFYHTNCYNEQRSD